MRHGPWYAWVLVGLGLFGLAASPTGAQTTANGPDYAPPSWDQQVPASPRFIVLSNWASAAVLDRETGLVWEKSPDTTPQTWDNAQYACMNKNVAGRGGWKLPSIQELRSLVDPTASNPALPAGHPFSNVQSSGYWSATTTAPGLASSAWTVIFQDGSVSGDETDDPHYIWCVRGGSGGDAQ